MALAAGAESSKVHHKPLIMRVIAVNIAPIPINAFATLSEFPLRSSTVFPFSILTRYIQETRKQLIHVHAAGRLVPIGRVFEGDVRANGIIGILFNERYKLIGALCNRYFLMSLGNSGVSSASL
jgi:hypothetical protein